MKKDTDNRKRALVAHADPATRKRMARLIGECGYEAFETGDLFNTCRALFYMQCDLFVCGMDLGEFTTAEVLTTLREQAAPLPRTIILSNEWASHPDAHVVRLLASACLPEHVSAEALFTTVLEMDGERKQVRKS